MPDNELIFSEKAIKNAIRKEIRNEKETKKLESGKNSLEKADNEIKKIQKASKTQNKKINIKNSKLSKNVQNKTKIENKLEIKSIKLQNIGPFDEKGLTINFGKKLNTKKANVHIFVGENGSGKSSIANSFDMVLNFSKIKKNNDFDYRLDFDRKTKIQLILNNGKITTLEAQNRLDLYPIIYSQETPDTETFAYSPANFYQTTVTNFNPNSGIKFIGNKSILEEVKLNDIANWAGNLDYEIKQNLHKEKRKLALDKSLEKIKEILTKDFEWGYDTDKREFLPKINDKFISFVSLSDGHKTTLSLFSDLLYRVYDNFKEFDDFLDKHFILILDEIDIHLHPKAQRRILPALQSLFPNAEIFCTTHSPFVVNSVSDAWVYELSEENYVNEKGEKWQEKDGMRFLNPKMTSIFEDNQTVLSEDFNYDHDFGEGANELLDELFYSITSKKITKKNKKIVEKIRLSQNESLKSKLEFLLSKNSLDF